MGLTFDTNYLLVSMLWGTVGAGFLVYGRKQGAVMPTVCGVTLIAAAFIPSALIMSAICLCAIAGTTWLARRGF